MTLGQKIKKLRLEKGLTQKDLADQVYVTFQTVSKWEKDENEPDVSTLRELAKLFGCSMDYLLSEDDVEAPEEVVEEPEPAPAEPVTKTIVIHQKELHVCEKCKKDIPEDELEIDQICVSPGGRGRIATYRPGYYHKSCLAELRREKAAAENREKSAKASKAKKRCFGWGGAIGVIALGASIALFIVGGINPGLSVLYGFLIGYAVFADLYCILSGSYIGDVFLHVASWSVRFPGIIFSWDLGGFIFLIAMKVLFAILGFFIGIFVFLLAVGISAILASVSFPFVLIHNIHNQYDDAF